MSTYFSDTSLKFLRNLARHNNREWFHAHKADYETHVREPFQRLLIDLQPALAQISAHYRSEPGRSGGSLYRIYRDTRYTNDKSPYKNWQGARLFHARRKQVEAPAFYLHLEPGGSFVGAGIWHPQPDTLRRIRHFILDNPGSWKAAAHGGAFRRRFDLDDSEMLTRTPRGFPDTFEFAQDLRRKNFVALRTLDDATVTGPRLRRTIEADLAGLAPFVDYLCAALDLEF